MTARISEIFTDCPINDSGAAMREFTGEDRWFAVYTIQLGELIEHELFDWSSEDLDWKFAAYSDEQYERLCAYFIERFRFREISIIPYYEWARMVRYRLAYELMPKYKPLYQMEENGLDPLQKADEYYKERVIRSDYPETLLSQNSDYLSEGTDREYERVQEGSIIEAFDYLSEKWKSIDQLVCDGLESLFIGMYTTNINGL